MEIVELTDFFPVILTPLALSMAWKERIVDPTLTDQAFLRISVKGGGCGGYINELTFDDKFDPEDDIKKNFSVNDNILGIVVDTFSALYLKGITIDYVKTDFTEGFKFIGGESVKSTCGCGKSYSV